MNHGVWIICLEILVSQDEWIMFLQGCRSLETDEEVKKVETPSICLYQDELDNENFLFRTNIDEMEDQRWHVFGIFFL